jgi:hypothetical protein
MDLWTVVAAPDAIEFCLLLKLSAGRHTGGQHPERHLIVILAKKKVHIEVPSWFYMLLPGRSATSLQPSCHQENTMLILTYFYYR